MVEIIRNFNNPNPIDHSIEENTHMKTKMLELTIFKISTLLKRGFGELGAQTISDNIQIDEEEEKLLPGRRQYAIFLMVRITEFNNITNILQEEIIIFVNKIVRILHGTVKKWDGAANKNYGDKYLITWLLPSEQWHEIEQMSIKLESKAKRIEQEFLDNKNQELQLDLNALEDNESDSDSDLGHKKKKKKMSK